MSEEKKWKNAYSNPPKENGWYWVYVQELNGLGFSNYQESRHYNYNDANWNGPGRVTHWTELLPAPPAVHDEFTHIDWVTPEKIWEGAYVQMLQKHFDEAHYTGGVWKWFMLSELNVIEMNGMKDEWAERLRVPKFQRS